MLAGERQFVERCGELLELLAAVTVIAIVMALAGSANRLTLEHVKTVEAITLVSGARIDLHEHRAVIGSWPETARLELSGIHYGDDGFLGRYVEAVEYGAGGVLHFTMQEAAIRGPGYRLSMRAAVMPQQIGSPIVWICGYADAPAGFVALVRNETSIDASRLPASCRAARPAMRNAP